MSRPILRFLQTSAAAVALLVSAAGLRAQGAPPLNTDDTGTPDRYHWELNVGVKHARSEGGRETAFPAFDFSYGIAEAVEISYAVSGLSVKEKGAGSTSGLSNSEVGAKWRFHDGGKAGWKLAAGPYVEFNNPGSSAERKGLVERGAVFTLPLIIERELGEFTVAANVARSFHSRQADDWSYGLAVGRDVNEAVTLGVELFGEAANRLDRTSLLLNFGATIKVNEKNSLMLSAGRELHRHEGEKATLVGYLGWQIRL